MLKRLLQNLIAKALFNVTVDEHNRMVTELNNYRRALGWPDENKLHGVLPVFDEGSAGSVTYRPADPAQ